MSELIVAKPVLLSIKPSAPFMLRIILFTFITIFSWQCLAQNAFDQYSRVRIFLDGRSPAQLGKSGIDVSHSHIKKGYWVDTDVSKEELQRINRDGFRTQILVEDLLAHYKKQKSEHNEKSQNGLPVCNKVRPKPVPGGFILGSMGGYFYYEEMLAQLDSMRARFPNLITVKSPISTTLTHENRPIYGIKISDNPQVDETDEPEALYTAIHHAREPGAMSQVIYYMWYLLENYATDSSVRAIVNHSQLYFVPCLNPDGYIFNQTNFPDGGGMWRKNRRSLGQDVFGVDLNRNYGQFWGFDDNGSSPDPAWDTYRGPSAFSEPETQALKSYCEARRFQFALNYHTYSNLLIYPWGYSGMVTPDANRFINYGKLLTRENQYRFGTGMETLGYNANGSSDDWMYGETGTKPKIYSFTPECGSWFWETPEEIVPLCQSALEQNLSLAKLLMPFALVEDLSADVTALQQTWFKYRFTNLSQSNAQFRLNVRPLAGVSQAGAEKVYSLNGETTFLDSIALNLNGNIRSGDAIGWVAELNNGKFTQRDTIWHWFGVTSNRFADDFSTTTNWTGGWRVNTNQRWITDSPNGTYASNDTNSAITTRSIDLRNTNRAWLQFDVRFEIEELYDFAQVLASTDSGATWTALCGKQTRPAVPFTQRSLQNAPGYDGLRPDWLKESMDLGDLVGQRIWLKLLLMSDGFAEEDGVYIRDLKVVALETPTAHENLKNPGFSNVFPNPAEGNFTIHSTEPLRAVTITNLQGQVVAKTFAQGFEWKISSQNWAPGLYVVNIRLENGMNLSRKIQVLK